jgi:hypothetical protein
MKLACMIQQNTVEQMARGGLVICSVLTGRILGFKPEEQNRWLICFFSITLGPRVE